MTTSTTDPLTRFTADIVPRPIPEALLAARREVMAVVADLATLTDADLPKAWDWIGGSEDEIRYGFYRIYEDFERAGIDAAEAMRAAGNDRGRAADLIAPATAARWDLQGLLLQLPDATWDADPGGEEWTIRQTLGHVIGGQRGYGAATAWWQAQGLPANDDLPKVRPPFWAELPEDEEEGAGTPAEVRARLDELLDLSTERLAGLPPDRLSLGTRWAGFAVDIGFRIGRWSSHFREHAIQVEKTMVMIGHTPTEVDRLIRLILAAWGLAEAAVYGSTGADEAIAVLARAAAEAGDTASELIRVATSAPAPAPAAAPAPAPSLVTHDVERLRAFADRYTAAWCSMDPTRVAQHFAPGGSLTINDGPPAIGRAAITQAANGFYVALPDMQVYFDDLVLDGDRIEFHWTFTGTNTGPGGTGKRVRVSGFEEWTLDDHGLIATSRGHYDAAEYARQLEQGTD
jgi:predicted ester cyclase